VTRERRRRPRPSPWAFDPDRLAGHELDAWVAYYRRDWRRVLTSAVGMVREGFGMGRCRTIWGAWLLLRANQAWAPYPDNDPDSARRLMRRFYELVGTTLGLALDPRLAAELEVAWWHAHRVLQREDGGDDESALVDALARLYAHVYSRPEETLREAATHRAAAMCQSDAWVAAGCRLDDPRLGQERKELERSYQSLLLAIGSPAEVSVGRRKVRSAPPTGAG